jgi:hypothetical protein
MDEETKKWVRHNALDFVIGGYESWRTRREYVSHAPEPAYSVGVVTDYLRQLAGPDDFHYDSPKKQYAVTRGELEKLVRAGRLSKSVGENEHGVEASMYEPPEML